MIIRDLFACLNTDTPRITIYDDDENIVYQKHANKPIGKFKFWNCAISWLYKADSREIVLRIEDEEQQETDFDSLDF